MGKIDKGEWGEIAKAAGQLALGLVIALVDGRLAPAEAARLLPLAEQVVHAIRDAARD